MTTDRRTSKTAESEEKKHGKPRRKRKGKRLDRYKEKVQVKTLNERGEEIIVELSDEEISERSRMETKEEPE
jgi:hypothetical protein